MHFMNSEENLEGMQFSHKDTQPIMFTTYCLASWELGFSLRRRELIARAGRSKDLDVPVRS